VPATTRGRASSGPFWSKYSVGRVLGRGAFGIVCLCTCRRSGRELAVKKVDKQKSSPSNVKREVTMLRNLAHPSVVKLHDVCADAHSVYMVFTLYRGGDLIGGMERHWDSKGQIPMAVVRNLGRQIFRSIAWLHENNVVHRDVKADNYLLDRADLEHPASRICLSDFGFAAELRLGERLTKRCGTAMYWAPEVYARSYAFKVDVWAAGVLTYGLVAETWPFKGEKEVCAKNVGIPSRCGEADKSFLLKALKVSEVERFSASEALQHPCLASVESAAQAAGTSTRVCAQSQVKKVGLLQVKVSLASDGCSSDVTTSASSSSGDERKSFQDRVAGDNTELVGRETMACPIQLSST